MLMGCLGALGASVSLKMPSFEIGCFYVHNIFLSFWKARPMVWESSVPAALCIQASSIAQTVSMVQPGAKVGLSSHMSLPFHQIKIWDGKCFIKSSLLEQGFLMHLGHNGQSFPVQRNPLDDVSMAGAEGEEEQDEHLPEDVSGIMGIQDTLVIAQSNGIFHHHIQ